MVVLLEAPATQQNCTDSGSRCSTKQRKWTYEDVYGDGFGWPNKGGCLQWWFWMLKHRKWTYEDVWCGDFGCWNKGNGCLGMFAVVVLGAESKEMDLWGCLKWWFWVPKQRKWTYGDVFLVFWSTQPCTHSPLCRRTQGWKKARLYMWYTEAELGLPGAQHTWYKSQTSCLLGAPHTWYKV